ncbi:alpha/beta hydrolase [Chitinophaga sancti]|uniref:Acetyl esterase/lipase n=1 Tax=Chitinophaga sancti TaxID=1004 RepID=A0A1K1S2J4_9BACT|nr:alpha/beta hydrolase [Chitinophaga sancti]WQD59660.1 alpha/beta hydrolase [Chitinophaga sancti]WQG88209.1 alpha/beta hydrolase [Chitinophaga sancti]SFW78402.1 Acetyl esterase/lipase [Chitinophaga sancti]
MRKLLFLFLTATYLPLMIHAQEIIPLYKDSIPGALPAKIELPDLTIYLPKDVKHPTTGILIIPGGGYGFVSSTKEGSEIASYFAKKGVAAFVLKYRLPSDATMRDKKTGPIQDAQRALQIIRLNAEKWGVDNSKIGVIGFSAGGHLASTLGTHFNKSFITKDATTSLRPDFMILVYPVITMKKELTHAGSRMNLLGKAATEEDVNYFSNEEQVTPTTPPTYLTHAGDDKVVSVQNSIAFYQALLKNHVSAEMLLVPQGDHGFIFQIKQEEYMDPIFLWMRKGGWLDE